jgi:hypothetical protein
MDLFAAAVTDDEPAGIPTGFDPFHAPKPKRKSTRTSPATPAMVREVESNDDGNLSPGDQHRTCGDHRQWIRPSETRFWHSSWANRRQKILRGMEAAGYPEGRIERFVNCGSFTRIVEDADTGDLRARASHCHDRFCTRCCKAKALLIADNLEKRIAEERCDYLHIVLTTKHNQRPLGEQIDAIYKNFKKLRTGKLFRNCVDGGAAFLQVHVAKSDELWHVHFHILGRGKWLDAFELAYAWLKITGDSYNVDVSKVRDAKKAVREVCRYAAKPVDGDTTNDPQKLAELMRAMTGRRVCFTFGKWRKYQLTKNPELDPEKRWIDHGPLDAWIARAAAGEEHAKHVISVVLARVSQRRGPPDLFDHDL